MNTLFTTAIKDQKNFNRRKVKQPAKTVQVQITKAGKILSFKTQEIGRKEPDSISCSTPITELEEKMFKVKLTVIDTPGFGDYVNNRHSWIPIVDFIDDQHEKYMRQEQQPSRKGIVDMRVHACLYFIKPTGHR